MKYSTTRAVIVTLVVDDETWPSTVTALENEMRAIINGREAFSDHLRAAEPCMIGFHEIEENPV